MESIDLIFEELSSGDRSALGRAITLIESSHPRDHESRLSLLHLCKSQSDQSIRIGITGAPGVGKSCLIEKLGLSLIEHGHKVAVLAIDPSSQYSGGSILGDKTRMIHLARHPAAYVRPSPASGILGGVAEMTRETILLCESAGFDRILVETVGIGQSETGAASITDILVFVTMAGGGDSLQGIKRGILEVVDLVAVNKADLDNIQASERYLIELGSALHLLRGPHVDTPSFLTSALKNKGIEDLFMAIQKLARQRLRDGSLQEKRKKQRSEWFDDAIQYLLSRSLDQDESISADRDELSRLVVHGDMNPYVAADRHVKRILNRS